MQYHTHTLIGAKKTKKTTAFACISPQEIVGSGERNYTQTFQSHSKLHDPL